jgi:hypothetical protein
MIALKLSYLAGNLYLLAIWIYFFWKWPNRRIPMLVVGLIFIPIGLSAEYFWWTVDWWHPQTLTGTRLGIEDIFLSFSLPGISILIYKFVFKKDLDEKFELNKKTFLAATFKLIPIVFFSLGTTAILFYIFHVPSFFSSSAGMLIAGLYILYFRRDLYPTLFWSALLMVLVSLPIYFLWQAATPDIIEKFWNLPQMTGAGIFHIPIEDVIWFALVGFCMGGLVEYAFGYRLVDTKE